MNSLLAKKLRLGSIALAGLLSLAWAAAAMAQGILIIRDPMPLPRPVWNRPEPPMSYKIKELGVDARLQDQVARVQVSQTFVNTGSQQMEVQFCFPLPYDGAIDQLTFMVDGKEYEAKLLAAKDARSIYESYVRRSKDPALLEWMGTGMFQTSVFPVPPGAERKVTLKYSQLLRKHSSLVDFLFPLGTAKYTSRPVEKVAINLAIETAGELKNIYSPTHSVEIKRNGTKNATVKYEVKDQVPVDDFRLFYDTGSGKVATSVVSYRPDPKEDGYFLLLATPEIPQGDKQTSLAKNVVFVLDRSGSMSGKKIEQAREALKFVVNNLKEGDRFNIVAYDTAVESFKPDLVSYDTKTRDEALGYINGLYPGGGTNIDGGLKKAWDLLKTSDRPNFIVFLTDGRPTVGEINEGKIVENARQGNKLKARLITFGVGYDLNSRLLDRLSHENYGQSEYVRPNEDIEAHVSKVYTRISSPVMTDVAVKFDFDAIKTEEGDPINRRYPKEVRDVFAGEQVVLVGRYRKTGVAKVIVTGKVGDKTEKMDFPADMVAHSGDQSFAFVEKLWAVRRIGEIIDELDMKGKNDELVNELVGLSTKHGILTPYTSFLADDQPSTGPGQGGPLADRRLLNRSHLLRAGEALDKLGEADGRGGFAQRSEKREFAEAPRAPGAQGFGFAGGGGPRSFNGPADAKPGDPAAAGLSSLGAKFRDIDSDKELATDAVQTVGNETLYRRGKTWIDAKAANLDPEKDKAKIKEIARFSDEYFQLVKENSTSENSLLARQQEGDEFLVLLRGQAYLIK